MLFQNSKADRWRSRNPRAEAAARFWYGAMKNFVRCWSANGQRSHGLNMRPSHKYDKITAKRNAVKPNCRVGIYPKNMSRTCPERIPEFSLTRPISLGWVYFLGFRANYD